MTDRHAGYVVTLAQDIREDDAQDTLTAIRQVRGVVDVQPVTANLDQTIAASRRDTAWSKAILELVRDGPAG